MIITFKASDRKTRVFFKFDLNNEAALFYDYFIGINRIQMKEIKERTKSLGKYINKFLKFFLINVLILKLKLNKLLIKDYSINLI